MVTALIGLLVLQSEPAQSTANRLEFLRNQQVALDVALKQKEEIAAELPSLQRRAAALGVRASAPFVVPPEVPAPSELEADPVRRAEQQVAYTQQRIQRLEKIVHEVNRLNQRLREAPPPRY